MINSYSNEIPNNNSPVTLGTRAQQLAMFVVYESPLQTLCDSPPVYEKSEGFDFIKAVPTIWDNTIVLDGKIGEYIVIARKNGDDWYVGAMTNWQKRDIEISFAFLDNKNYSAEIYADARDSDKNPWNTDHSKRNINENQSIQFHLAPGGGLAIQLHTQ